MGLTSFMNHDNPSQEFLLEDIKDNLNADDLTNELGDSFLEEYFESDKLSTIGLRLGVLISL